MTRVHPEWRFTSGGKPSKYRAHCLIRGCGFKTENCTSRALAEVKLNTHRQEVKHA